MARFHPAGGFFQPAKESFPAQSVFLVQGFSDSDKFTGRD
jgi:hypothetical protein